MPVMSDRWRALTSRWIVDDIPSARFPIYGRGNAGEIFPNVVTPLTGSLGAPLRLRSTVASDVLLAEMADTEESQ
jgi:hypothetical protein